MPANPPRAPGELAEIEALPDDPHFIRRGGGWFRPKAQGYTLRIAEAGMFSGDEARAYKADVSDISIHPLASVRTDLADAIVEARRALAQCEAAYARAGGPPFERSNVVRLVPALDQHSLTKNEGGER